MYNKYPEEMLEVVQIVIRALNETQLIEILYEKYYRVMRRLAEEVNKFVKFQPGM